MRTDRCTLLLVDDKPDNLLALEGLLRRHDLEIVSATSGAEALELLLDRDISLAIIDVQMPEMDGFELARLMRGVEKTRSIPIIFVTAGSECPAWIFEAYGVGAVDFLWKPIDPIVLAAKVDVFIVLDKQRRALQQSEQRFRSLVEATSQVVWSAAPSGLVVEDSPSWCEFTGQRFEQFEGRGWLDAIHPDDRQRASEAWDAAIARGLPGELEHRLRRPNGSYTWTVARWAPVLDDRGALVEWVVTNTDISARKETERLRDMFIAILGHDLRNPVGSILTTTQLVLTRTNDDTITGPLQRVLASGERVVRMIAQLLDMTRIRMGGGIAIAPVEVDLQKLADDALAELPSGKSRARIEVAGDPCGTWDADRLFQIASNLVGNALQHSPEGAPVLVKIDGTAAGHVELAVHNSGPAVPAALRDRIFEPFRGAHEHNGGRGLGLGLFITEQLTRAHGGTLRFESSDERGTLFVVRLPRHTRARGEVEHRAPADAPAPDCRSGGAGIGLDIVVLDDSEDAAEMFAELLRAAGHRVRIAYRGAEALALLDQQLPDVVFVDVELPDMTGYDVASKIRERFGDRLRLVALTGYSGREHRDEAERAGFDEYMVKPPRRRELETVLSEVAR